VFGEHDQCGAGLVQTWIHSRCDLFTSCERQTDVNPVAHFVCVQRATNFLDQLIVGWNRLERKRLGGVTQTLEVLDELENLAVVETKPLPHRVTTLYHAIKRAHARLAAMNELTVDVDNQVLVFFVEWLPHGYALTRYS